MYPLIDSEQYGECSENELCKATLVQSANILRVFALSEAKDHEINRSLLTTLQVVRSCKKVNQERLHHSPDVTSIKLKLKASNTEVIQVPFPDIRLQLQLFPLSEDIPLIKQIGLHDKQDVQYRSNNVLLPFREESSLT